MADFDDARTRSAMRAFVTAADELDEAVAASSEGHGSREVIDRADAKTLAEMALRKQLERTGWTAPREPATAESD